MARQTISYLIFSILVLTGCTSKTSSKTELWIYTSLYKDTVADIQAKVEKQFPNIEFHFYQAGSEEIAAKVNAEELAGGTKADVLISSDRFWYEDLAAKGKLHAFKPSADANVPAELKNPDGFYSSVSLPVMVLAYNKEAIDAKSAPKTFKEMMEPKWKNKFSTGSPLASGTNFTTIAFLQKAYGWDYFKALRKNDTISEGGNSGVVRRLQTKERPVGWVLLENMLRFKGVDDRLVTVYPEDGVVIHSNIIAIRKKPESREAAEKFVNWMFEKEGQEAMVKAFMYSPIESYAPPVGAPPFAELKKKSFPWSQEFVKDVTQNREKIKEEFTKIMFQ